MAYLLMHPKFDDIAFDSDISDGAYRALVTSFMYAVKHHTDWLVPWADVMSLTPTITRGIVHELIETRWWVPSEAAILLAIDGPGALSREVLVRRCQSDRPPIPAALRQAIYERDRFRCVECSSGADLTLDHIWPWSRGGSDEPDNLRTLCRPCNSRKGARV